MKKFDGVFAPFCERDRSRYVMGLGHDCPVALRGQLCDELAVMGKSILESRCPSCAEDPQVRSNKSEGRGESMVFDVTGSLINGGWL